MIALASKTLDKMEIGIAHFLTYTLEAMHRHGRSLRILTVFIEPPLPFAHAAGRWYAVILKGLTARGHRVTALATCARSEDIPETKRVFPAPDYDVRCYLNPARAGWKSKLNTLRRPHSHAFSDALIWDLDRELKAGFDILYLENLWSGWTGLAHRKKAVLSVLYSFAVDLEGVPTQSLHDRIRRIATDRAERHLLRTYSTICAVSDPLRDRIRQINPRARVVTVPLAIDLSLYRFAPNAGNQPPVVGLIGSFDWQPTYQAAVRLITSLWPGIRRQVPDCRLHLVGRAASCMQRFRNSDLIEIHENVKDIEPYFRKLDVLLYAPEHGSGMKVKVMEAFGFGVPVVTSTCGSEGLPVRDGVHLGLADEDDALIARTVALLRSRDLRERQARAGRNLLESHCSPEASVGALEDVFQALAGPA